MPVVLLLAMGVCATLGVTIERLAYKPLRKAPRLNVLITAIGVSLFLQNVGQLRFIFGATPQSMPALLVDRPLLTFSLASGGGSQTVVVGLVDTIIFVTAGVLMLILEYLVFRTKLGTAMRAVSFNTDTAALMGIAVDRVISFTFVLGSMLAAAAGFLLVMKYSKLDQPAHAVWVLLG